MKEMRKIGKGARGRRVQLRKGKGGLRTETIPKEGAVLVERHKAKVYGKNSAGGKARVELLDGGSLKDRREERRGGPISRIGLVSRITVGRERKKAINT